MATIEILGNPMIDFEKNEMAIEIEQNDLQSFWEWEAGLLRQEVEHFETQLRSLKQKIDRQVESRIAQEVKSAISADLKGDAVKRVLDNASSTTGKKISLQEKIRQEVEAKFADRKKFLLESYDRAIFEEQVHLKQKSHNKYKNRFL